MYNGEGYLKVYMIKANNKVVHKSNVTHDISLTIDMIFHLVNKYMYMQYSALFLNSFPDF